MEVLVIILILLLAASGWVAYGITLRLVNDRNVEKERYVKAIELVRAQSYDEIQAYKAEADLANSRAEEEYARGKQEGKRATLDWIKGQVDEGTLVVKVVGTPNQTQR